MYVDKIHPRWLCATYKAAVVNLVSTFFSVFILSLSPCFSLHSRVALLLFVSWRRQENLPVGVTIVAANVIFSSQKEEKKNESMKKNIYERIMFVGDNNTSKYSNDFVCFVCMMHTSIYICLRMDYYFYTYRHRALG